MFPILLENIDLIEVNKDDILTLWMEYEIVAKTLCSHEIKVDFFKDKFATKVFDFATSVIKSQNEVGDCPVIGVMLMLFKKKNIPLADIFMICVHLKNAFLLFLQKHSLLNAEMINEISILMDYNFNGVIKEYTLLYYEDNYRISYCAIDNKPSKEEMQIAESNASLQETISAETYLNEIELDTQEVAELADLESDAIDAIEEGETITQNSLEESAHLFEQYAKVLNSMYEFKELAYTLTILIDLLHTTQYHNLDDETKYMVTIYLKAIISDLQSWRMSVFITHEAEDIHYLDKTLLSSIAQLQITLMPKKEDQEDKIEFF